MAIQSPLSVPFATTSALAPTNVFIGKTTSSSYRACCVVGCPTRGATSHIRMAAKATVVHAKKIAKMRYIFRISVIRPYREPRGDDGGNCSDHTSYARGDSPSPDCFEPCGFEQIGI